MLDREPDMEAAERHRRDGEEVHGCGRIAVIARKHKPARHSVGMAWTPRQVPRDGALRDLEAEHAQLGVDTGAPQVAFSVGCYEPEPLGRLGFDLAVVVASRSGHGIYIEANPGLAARLASRLAARQVPDILTLHHEDDHLGEVRRVVA